MRGISLISKRAAWFASILVLLLASSGIAWADGDEHHGMWDDMWGHVWGHMWGHMWGGGVWALLWIALIMVVVLVALSFMVPFGWTTRREGRRRDPLEAAEERLAKGEITPGEFDQIKERIS
jgi:uncharacterized membrane protein